MAGLETIGIIAGVIAVLSSSKTFEDLWKHVLRKFIYRLLGKEPPEETPPTKMAVTLKELSELLDKQQSDEAKEVLRKAISDLKQKS